MDPRACCFVLSSDQLATLSYLVQDAPLHGGSRIVMVGISELVRTMPPRTSCYKQRSKPELRCGRPSRTRGACSSIVPTCVSQAVCDIRFAQRCAGAARRPAVERTPSPSVPPRPVCRIRGRPESRGRMPPRTSGVRRRNPSARRASPRFLLRSATRRRPGWPKGGPGFCIELWAALRQFRTVHVARPRIGRRLSSLCGAMGSLATMTCSRPSRLPSARSGRFVRRTLTSTAVRDQYDLMCVGGARRGSAARHG
jgi:hypothetical protein